MRCAGATAAALASARALSIVCSWLQCNVPSSRRTVVRRHAHAEEEVRRRHMKCGARQRRRSRSRVRARCLAETAHLFVAQQYRGERVANTNSGASGRPTAWPRLSRSREAIGQCSQAGSVAGGRMQKSIPVTWGWRLRAGSHGPFPSAEGIAPS